MTIRARSNQKPAIALHVLVAGVIGLSIIAVALDFGRNGSTEVTVEHHAGFAPSSPPAVAFESRFAEEMALHEALTESAFGPTDARSAGAARAIEQHSADFPQGPLAPSRIITIERDEIAWAIAQHAALIEPFVS